jgi:sugar lactone lactonase YvrE
MPANIEVAARGDQHGECATWCERTRRLWWSDLFGVAVRCCDPATGRTARHSLAGATLGSFALREQGGLLLALDNRLVLFDPESGDLGALAGPEDALDHRHFNDGRCDRQGRFWVGAMDANVTAPNGVVYRVDADHTVHRMFGDFKLPNAAAFSPDGRTYYFSDCRARLIWAFELDPASGELGKRRVFADTASHPGQPDGSCVDADGCLWNAEFFGGRVVRFAPDGRLDRVIELPVARPTCCTFGGPDLDTLYVTTARRGLSEREQAEQPLAGCLLALRPGVRGLPEPYYRG